MLAVSLLTLGDPEQLTGGYLYHRRMADLAPDHGANVRFVSFRPRPFPLPALEAPRVMGRAMHGDTDVLLLDSICAAFLAPWLATQRPRLPLVAILHQPPGGIDAGGPRRTVQAMLDSAAYRRARTLVLASEALREQLPQRVTQGREVLVVPPGRDVASAADDVGDLRRGRRAALLCVGNWVPRKGILELLDAFATLPADAATLHLAGRADVDADYGASVRNRLQRADVAGRVVVHGAVSRTTIAGLYRSADVFVLASTKEPYGTVYGEAMAAGLPVVGWDAGNLPHLAVSEREGVAVPPGDVAALGAALVRLVHDEPFRRRLAEAARRKADSFPTWEESATQLFTVLARAAAARRPRR